MTENTIGYDRIGLDYRINLTQLQNDIGTAKNMLSAFHKNAEKGARTASSILNNSQRAMERWSASGMKATAMSKAAWLNSGSIISKIINIVIDTIVQATADLAQYHQNLKNLQALTRANADDMKLMDDAIRSAAVGTKFFNEDLADAATIMAQAGFSAREIANAIGAVAVLASATGKDIKEVADLMTSVIRTYDLNAGEALRVANVLAAGISETKLPLDTLITTLNTMGAAAHQFNMPLEDTVAWLGVLRDQGMEASTIGTSFRNVLATLGKETDRFSTVLKDLPEPLDFSDITIRNGRKIEDAMQRLSDAGFDIADAFVALPSQTAMTFALMADNTGTFENLRKKITGTNRAVEMNATVMEGMQSQWSQIKSIFDEFLLAFTESGGTMEPIVRILKLIVQVSSTALLNIGLLFNVVGTGISHLMTAISKIKMPKITPAKEWKGFSYGLNVDFSNSFPDADELSKDMKQDYKDILDEYAGKVSRIVGEKGLFGDNVFLPESTEEMQKAKETLSSLNQEKDKIVKTMGSLNKKDPIGAARWDTLHEKLLVVNGAIKALETQTLETVDAVKGPMASLQDVMLDMVVDKDMAPDELLAFFTKGEEDVELLQNAVAKLRAEFTKAHEEWSNVLSKDSEEYKRMIALGQTLTGAEQTLARLRKKMADDQKREDDERERNNKNEQKEAIKFREDLERDYLDTKKDVTRQVMKETLSEVEYTKWAANEEYKARKEKLDKQIKEAREHLKALEENVNENPLLASQIELLNNLIPKLEALNDNLPKPKTPEPEPADHDPKDFAGGVKSGIAGFAKEIGDEFMTWKNVTANVATGMLESFETLFFDAMQGDLKSLSDYWDIFKNTVIQGIAEIAAKWAIGEIFGNFGGLGKTSEGEKDTWGLIGSLFTFGQSHEGGLIRATNSGGLQRMMHAGGLASNERSRILKTNEYVIRDSAVGRLGVENLDYMNRTGQMPPSEQTVVNNYKTYISAVDAQSFDTLLRQRGAKAIHDISLGSYARARGKRDRRVSR